MLSSTPFPASSFHLQLPLSPFLFCIDFNPKIIHILINFVMHFPIPPLVFLPSFVLSAIPFLLNCWFPGFSSLFFFSAVFIPCKSFAIYNSPATASFLLSFIRFSYFFPFVTVIFSVSFSIFSFSSIFFLFKSFSIRRVNIFPFCFLSGLQFSFFSYFLHVHTHHI